MPLDVSSHDAVAKDDRPAARDSWCYGCCASSSRVSETTCEPACSDNIFLEITPSAIHVSAKTAPAQVVGKEEQTDIKQIEEECEQKSSALDPPCKAVTTDASEDVALAALSTKERIGAWLMIVFNFWLANVGDGMGPIQAVYLVSARGWSAGTAGLLWMFREIAIMVASPYVGNLFDSVHQKKLWLASFMTFMTAVNLVIMFTDELPILILRALAGGAAQSAIKCGFSSLTLGIVGPRRFDEWAAKGESANHLGCLIALLIAGVVSYLYFPDVQFLFAVFGTFGAAGVVSVLCIPHGVIDYNRARNLKASRGNKRATVRATPSSSDVTAQASAQAFAQVSLTSVDMQPVTNAELLRNRNLVLWHVIIFMWHMSNSPALPLLGQVISDPVGTAANRRLTAASSDREGMLWACGLIVICNLVSAVVAAATDAMLNYVSWKKILFFGFLTQLPRTVGIAVIMRVADSNRVLLSATQILHGVSASVNGMSCMVVTGILTEGSGKFGTVSGTINMAWAAAAAVSNVSIGFIADQSYEVAFYICGAFGVLTLILVMMLKIESIYDTEALDKRSISLMIKVASITSSHSFQH